MAQKWCMEYGVLSVEDVIILFILNIKVKKAIQLILKRY